MSNAVDLLTLEEAKLWVNLSLDRVGNEDRLEQWVTGVSMAFDEYAGPVVAREVTETHHVDRAGSLNLRETPVYSITTVTEYQSGSGTVLTAEDHDTEGTYVLDGYTLYRRSGWTPTTFLGQVRVTYQAGRYASTATVSAQFKTAAGMVLQRLWSQYAPAWARGGPTGDDGTDGFYFRAVAPVASELGIQKRIRPLVA